MDLETWVLETMLLKLSTDPSSIDFVTPPGALHANLHELGYKVAATEGDANAGRHQHCSVVEGDQSRGVHILRMDATAGRGEC
jgi:hypothetical protein